MPPTSNMAYGTMSATGSSGKGGLLTELVGEALAMNADQDWTEAFLYTPYLNEQSLLYEYADCLAAQTFLRMCQLPFSVKQRPNADFISPTGKVPLLRLSNTLIPEFNGIVDFVAKKGVKLSGHLSEVQQAEMAAHMSVVDFLLRNIEMHIVWLHSDTYADVTKQRVGSVYHWPLNSVLPAVRRRCVQQQMADTEWAGKSMEELVDASEKAFRALSSQLATHTFLMGDQPTEADALAFGHLYSILTVQLPCMELANTLKKYPNLVEYVRRIEAQYWKQ